MSPTQLYDSYTVNWAVKIKFQSPRLELNNDNDHKQRDGKILN